MMQAKDIDDRQFLRTVVSLAATPQAGWAAGPRWVSRWELEGPLGAPQKLVLAKARKLIRRGLLDGCDCGCRGDFELTERGCEFLADTA